MTCQRQNFTKICYLQNNRGITHKKWRAHCCLMPSTFLQRKSAFTTLLSTYRQKKNSFHCLAFLTVSLWHIFIIKRIIIYLGFWNTKNVFMKKLFFFFFNLKSSWSFDTEKNCNWYKEALSLIQIRWWFPLQGFLDWCFFQPQPSLKYFRFIPTAGGESYVGEKFFQRKQCKELPLCTEILQGKLKERGVYHVSANLFDQPSNQLKINKKKMAEISPTRVERSWNLSFSLTQGEGE